VVAERMEEAASVYSAYPTHELVTVAGALANARAGGSFTGRRVPLSSRLPWLWGPSVFSFSLLTSLGAA